MFGRYRNEEPRTAPVSDAPTTLDKKSQDNGDSIGDSDNNNNNTTAETVITAPTRTGSDDDDDNGENDNNDDDNDDDEDEDDYPKGLRLALVLSSV